VLHKYAHTQMRLMSLRHNWERNLPNFFRIRLYVKVQSCVPTADISFLCTGDPAEGGFLWQFQTCACPTGGPWRRCSCWRICWTTAHPPPPQPGHPRSSGSTFTFTQRYTEVTHSGLINRYLGVILKQCLNVLFFTLHWNKTTFYNHAFLPKTEKMLF